MSGLIRLFTAIDLHEPVKAQLAGLINPALAVRWTPRQQYHITLRFLGDTDPEHFSLVQRTLKEIEAQRFTLHTGAIDAFPSRKNPRVIILRLEACHEFFRLQQNIQQALQQIGFPPDNKPFQPHITLARQKGARTKNIDAFFAGYDASAIQPFLVSEFHLYESTLSSAGAIHKKLSSYKLSPAS